MALFSVRKYSEPPVTPSPTISSSSFHVEVNSRKFVFASA